MMRLWWFFSRRECKMELLQEEMDRLEMSCLQGESWPGRGDVGEMTMRWEVWWL